MRLPPRSAYLHIPFCYRRCHYCDFAIVPLGNSAGRTTGTGQTLINSYLKLLHWEIALTPSGPPLATVYIGGGTPSLLTASQIRELLDALSQHYGLLPGAEITLEMDPASFGQVDLKAILATGVNRISLGGQSFDDAVLKSLGRRHCRQDLLDSCNWLDLTYRQGQLVSWNLDLIHSLPGQTHSSWLGQLIQAVASSAPHLSIYELSVEPGTVFYRRWQHGKLALPDEDVTSQFTQATNNVLNKAGYSRYEISSYAWPGHASRHNRTYWSHSGWWAFGLGATSAPWGERLARPRTLEAYRHWLITMDRQGVHHSLLAQLARPATLDDILLVGLRRREGVDADHEAKRCGWSAALREEYLPDLKRRWSKFLEYGWLEQRGRRWRLTDPEGMGLSNQVLVEVILWWDSLPACVAALPNPEGLRCTTDGQKSGLD
ncbi:radical SAM protein [cyanobiont of Ornithocercus magnificus]|nr:radical SAM protein [cyanobiont of Ornithocercus magnificus]